MVIHHFTTALLKNIAAVEQIVVVKKAAIVQNADVTAAKNVLVVAIVFVQIKNNYSL